MGGGLRAAVSACDFRRAAAAPSSVNVARRTPSFFDIMSETQGVLFKTQARQVKLSPRGRN